MVSFHVILAVLASLDYQLHFINSGKQLGSVWVLLTCIVIRKLFPDSKLKQSQGSLHLFPVLWITVLCCLMFKAYVSLRVISLANMSVKEGTSRLANFPGQYRFHFNPHSWPET